MVLIQYLTIKAAVSDQKSYNEKISPLGQNFISTISINKYYYLFFQLGEHKNKYEQLSKTKEQEDQKIKELEDKLTEKQNVIDQMEKKMQLQQDSIKLKYREKIEQQQKQIEEKDEEIKIMKNEIKYLVKTDKTKICLNDIPDLVNDSKYKEFFNVLPKEEQLLVKGEIYQVMIHLQTFYDNVEEKLSLQDVLFSDFKKTKRLLLRKCFEKRVEIEIFLILGRYIEECFWFDNYNDFVRFFQRSFSTSSDDDTEASDQESISVESLDVLSDPEDGQSKKYFQLELMMADGRNFCILYTQEEAKNHLLLLPQIKQAHKEKKDIIKQLKNLMNNETDNIILINSI